MHMQNTKFAAWTMISVSILLGALAGLQISLARSAFSNADVIERSLLAVGLANAAVLLFSLGVILIGIVNAARYVRDGNRKESGNP